MTDSTKYRILKGRKYDKLVRVSPGYDNEWREAIAFINQTNGMYRFAASWSKPGRFMTRDEEAHYAAIVTETQQGTR